MKFNSRIRSNAGDMTLRELEAQLNYWMKMVEGVDDVIEKSAVREIVSFLESQIKDKANG